MDILSFNPEFAFLLRSLQIIPLLETADCQNKLERTDILRDKTGVSKTHRRAEEASVQFSPFSEYCVCAIMFLSEQFH